MSADGWTIAFGRRCRQSPIACLTLCFAGGILIDRWIVSTLEAWLIGALVLSIVWVVLAVFRLWPVACVVLLLLWSCLGAATHHQYWSRARIDDITALAGVDSAPVEVTGVVRARPVFRPAIDRGGLPPRELTIFAVAVDSVRQGTNVVSASGITQVVVAGRMSHADHGDRVCVRGRIKRPAGPGNPGQFDYRGFLRRRGIRSVIDANSVTAIRVVESATWREPAWWTRRARAISSQILRAALSERVYPIAAAIVLGNRDYITPALRESFTESGTMHLLAISGLHVGILALVVWRFARLFRFRVGAEVATVVFVVLSYVVVTDMRPSVLRAGVLILSLMVSRLWYRPVSVGNALGLAALVLLTINPSDLFDVGAQLSFLSVLAIHFCTRRRFATDSAPNLLIAPWRRRVRAAGRAVLRDYFVMFGIAVATYPLVASSFNIYAPVGLVINVLLIRVVGIVLISGYAVVVVGFLAPFLNFLPAFCFEFGLSLISRAATFASEVSFGHRYGPAPSGWWLIVYYGLLAGFALSRETRHRRWCLYAAGIWVCVGLWRGPLRPDEKLRCTVLDVGHGSAVVLEIEDRVLVIDAGAMTGGDRAARTVREFLWWRGHVGIGGLLITHADFDHFNGVAPLLSEVPTGRLITTQRFRDSVEPAAVNALRVAGARSVPVSTVRRGHAIALHPEVTIEVVHPPEGAGFEDDNASSIVLLVRFAGQSVLLTGDISGRGLEIVRGRDLGHVDVLLAPHHGSRRENRPEINDWVAPRVVIASGRREAAAVVQEIYTAADCYVTARDGAVTCEIAPNGVLLVRPFRSEAERRSGL